MLVTRYYNLKSDNNLSKELTKVDFFFTGNSREMRAQKVISVLDTNFNGSIYSLNYDIEMERYSMLKLDRQYIHREENLAEKGKDLMKYFENDISLLEIENKNVLIDITSIKHPILFYFLTLLRKVYAEKLVNYIY